MERYILTLRCSDMAGIVLAAAQGIVHLDGNIVESDQFSDPPTGQFCMRIGFDSPRPVEEVRHALYGQLERFEPLLGIRLAAERRRALIMVSKLDHCLVDLLYRWNLGDSPSIFR